MASSSGSVVDPETQMERLVTRLLDLTCQSQQQQDAASGEISDHSSPTVSGYTEFGNNTSQPNSLTGDVDVDGIRVSLSCLVIGKVRECYISPDCLIRDEDVIIIESFLVHHVVSIIDASTSGNPPTVMGHQNVTWLTSMMNEVRRMLQSSFFLMSKINHSLLIPLLQVYDHVINNMTVVKRAQRTQQQDGQEGEEKVNERMSDLKESMKDLLILLFSFSVSPHEIQLFFDLNARHHRSILSPVPSRTGSATGTPVKSISGSVRQDTKDPGLTSGSLVSREDDENPQLQDDYFLLMSRSLRDSCTTGTGMVRNFFSFTSYSSLSLPPVKTFPIKGFTFGTSIRLESIVLLQKSALVKDYRMFLFSFKTSSSPPIGFSAYFSFPGNTTTTTTTSATDDHDPINGSNNNNSSSSPSYLKLTVSCFKGSLSPSLTHTLSFPFPLTSVNGSSGASTCSSGNSSDFIPLVITFSPTSLSLYLSGELMECNSNDWSISNMKSPIPSFDRCFIGCPFSPQSKVNVSNPNDSGFTGQLTSIYLFSIPLSGPAVSLFSTMREASNASSCFILSPAVNDSLLPTIGSSGSSGSTSSTSSNSSSSNTLLVKMKEREKFVKEINSSLSCLYSPSSVNWPIVLQNVNASTTSVSVNAMTSASISSSSSSHHHHHHHHSGSSTAAAAAAAAAAGSMVPALTSHSLIQGNLEVVQRNLLIDSMQHLNQGIDMMTILLTSFIREKRYSQFSQLFSFSLDLIASDVNHYFLESAVGTGFFKQILTSINSLTIREERARFLSLPSLFLPSLLSILQSLMGDKGGNAASSSSNTGGNIMLHPFMDGKEMEIRDVEVEKVRKMKLDCIKQVLELFIFNSFLWCQLIPDLPSENDPTIIQSSALSPVTQDEDPKEDGRAWKRKEETLVTLYSFLSTQLLSFPSSVHLLRRKRRAAFLLQVFHSLKSHFYHKKWETCNSSRRGSCSDSSEVKSDVNGIPDIDPASSDAGFSCSRKLFDRRERIVALIRSNILVFIKNLLTKTSTLCLTGNSSNSGGGSNGNSSSFNSKNSPGGSSSGSSTATAGTTVELLDAGSSSSNGDTQSESGGGGGGGGKMGDKGCNASSSASRMQDHHLMESMSASTLLEDSDESSFFEEETNCILNYLSILSREVLQRENVDQKSLLNLIDVLSLMNSILIEIPCSMIPSFDSRKGIQVLFQVMGNTIRSPYDADPGEMEEKEVIRSLCLKILGSFLMRSTFKRKSLSMTSSHFSILYYMLSRDRSILTHSLYVNLMEITIEAPISSLYSLQSGSNGGTSNAGHKKGGKNDLADDDYYWSSSIDATDREHERTSSACSSGKENDGSSSGSTIKIENPQMIKVIALLVVREKGLADQFLKDLFTLLLDSRSNRRLILQMSVWQSWLISFLKMDEADYDDKERRKREVTVVSLFKLLLYHALRWEFGGWRVWIDSLAIIHSFLSRESFNRMYANFETSQELTTVRNSSTSNGSSRSSTTANVTDRTVTPGPEGEEDEKPEDERSSITLHREAATAGPPRSSEATSSSSNNASGMVKRRLPTPTYRIPAFKWSSIHVQLLDSLLASIILDINSFRKEALMRANLNASPTTGMTDLRSESDTNESLILETLLMSSDIYVINIIHLISQLTDSTILDAGGLLPLLALATSSTSSSSSSCSSVGHTTGNNATNSSETSATSPGSRKSSDPGNPLEDDLMNEGRATELLHQLVFCADHLIFNTSLSSSSSTSSASQVTSSGSNSISLAELEAEKNMSSGGLLRQILRLVSMVSVKRVLSIKEKVRRSKKASESTGSADESVGKENGSSSCRETSTSTTTTAKSSDKKNDAGESSSEASDADSDDDVNMMTDRHHQVTAGMGSSASSIKRKFLSRYTIIDREEESDQLLLSVRDIHRLRATLYRSDPNTEKDRANANFLALSTMYFLSVLLVSKYRDTLDVVQTAVQQGTGNKTRSSESGRTGSSDKTADLSLMEKSLFPTVQFLKEIITDFESFLSKSLLGSKGQVLLTKQLVKRIKSNECSPLELVMLLCAQEFQNSLQKNAGLAFIELINEGRLLSISMKEHVIRVGIEADFILSRIEREERDRDTLFKRESYLIEEKREKEADLVQEVICNICCPADVSLSGPSFTLSVPCSASSFRSKLRGSKRKSFRDLEEFVSEKKIVLFKEDFLMQERESSSAAAAAAAAAAKISASSAIPVHRQTSTIGIESVIHQRTAVVASSSSSNSSTEHMKDEEISHLRDRVKELLSKVSTLEKERDHAILQLQAHKNLMQREAAAAATAAASAADDPVVTSGLEDSSTIKSTGAGSSAETVAEKSSGEEKVEENKDPSIESLDPGPHQEGEGVIVDSIRNEKEDKEEDSLVAVEAKEHQKEDAIAAVKKDEVDEDPATGSSP